MNRLCRFDLFREDALALLREALRHAKLGMIFRDALAQNRVSDRRSAPADGDMAIMEQWMLELEIAHEEASLVEKAWRGYRRILKISHDNRDTST